MATCVYDQTEMILMPSEVNLVYRCTDCGYIHSIIQY